MAKQTDNNYGQTWKPKKDDKKSGGASIPSRKHERQ